MRDADHQARTFMAAQHGLITSDQARGIGLTTDDIAHRVERGEWIRLTRRVLASRSSTPTNLRRLLVHVLDAGSGSALSHTSCLAHWGVRGFVDTPVHAVRHRQHLDHPVRGAIVHEVRYLPWDLVRTLEGIPVVMPSLGLLQVAGMSSVHRDRLARGIDAAWSDRLVTYDSLMAVADRMSRKGRRGLVRFRELVEERGPQYVPPASNLESRFASILERAGLPPMRRQIHSGSDTRWIGRVDFRSVDCPLIAEVQSERFHRGLLAERDDLERLTALADAGFVVVEVIEEDLFLRPDVVIAKIIEGRARALRRKAA